MTEKLLKAKMIVFQLGYNAYAVPRDKAAQLIELLGDAPTVHSPNYDHCYYLSDRHEPALKNLTLAEVTLTTEPKPED